MHQMRTPASNSHQPLQDLPTAFKHAAHILQCSAYTYLSDAAAGYDHMHTLSAFVSTVATYQCM
jgi:hypothetical protein